MGRSLEVVVGLSRDRMLLGQAGHARAAPRRNDKDVSSCPENKKESRKLSLDVVVWFLSRDRWIVGGDGCAKAPKRKEGNVSICPEMGKERGLSLVSKSLPVSLSWDRWLAAKLAM